MSAINEAGWLPLESNPEYLRKLGVKDDWEFVDVFAIEKEMLYLIPRPVLAVLLLFPVSAKGHTVMIGEETEVPKVYFIRQTIRNACGTIGLIHALLNNADKLCFDGEMHIVKFLNNTINMTPQERGILLESDTIFEEVHGKAAIEGQTTSNLAYHRLQFDVKQVPSQDDRVELHFVTFIHHEGALYELDGRRNGPVKHGFTTEDMLLEDSMDVVKKFIERDPLNLNFNVVALVKS